MAFSQSCEEAKIIINSLEVNYKIAGEGPAILVLHGWGGSSDSWLRVLEILASRGYRVIAPDLPGFGKSAPPPRPWNMDDYVNWIKEFSDLLGLDTFFLSGHSFGGGAAIKYSLQYPEKVKKLFLVAAAFARKKTFKKKFLGGASKIFKIFSFIPFYSLARKAFYKFIIRKSDYILAKGVMKESYLKVINEDLSATLSLIKTPTVIIWGNKDDVTPIKWAYFAKEKIKNSALAVIEGGDHYLERKMPQILSDKIEEFLK